jgi:exosome complex component RRP4
MRNIVTPGDLISEQRIMVRNTYVQNGKTYSSVLGMYEESGKEIIPLEGVWNPRIDDVVVGIIEEVKNKVYVVDLAYFGRSLIITGKYDKFEFNQGDVISAVIKDVEDNNTIILEDPRPLKGGTILDIKPKKIPRVIGKKSTMISQIAEATGTHIIVGMNGLIWMNGGNTTLATETLLKIEREAHLSGLTETIKKFLDERK